jgi:hypothetical protein
MATSRDGNVVEGARTQALFRDVNERIEEFAGGRAVAEWTILCECAEKRCVEQVVISEEEYERVRRFPTRFIVSRGHVYSDFERVVDQREGYAIVEKYGDGGAVAVELDPRRRAAAPGLASTP